MPGTCTVGCRLPNGLILRLYTMVEHDEPLIGGNGHKTVKRAQPLFQDGKPKEIKLNGSARFVGKEMPHDIRNGAGLTFGVDADFFAKWMADNKDSEIVKNGLVFAQTKAGEIEAQAKDHRQQVTGLEPLDPRNMPAEFKGKIETATAA